MPTTSPVSSNTILKNASDGNTPSAEAILEQLELILTSPEFLTTRRLRTFLRYIVDKTLDGASKTIKQYSIGIDVYERVHSFDPKADPLVRIEAGRLRRCLNRYYENNSEQAVILIEIPRGSYVPNFSLFSNNLADGLDDTLPNPVEETVANISQAPKIKELTPPVVAVFPFSFVGDEQYEYLSDHLPEELTDRLSMFPDMHVIASCTLHKYKHQLDDRNEVAASLGIDIALTGTLHITNKNLHLNLHLFMVDTGEQIWAESFDEPVTPETLFLLENKIIEQVTGKVADENGVITRYLSSRLGHWNLNPSSFEAFLQNHHFQKKFDQANFQKTLKSLEYAVQADPENATLHAILGQLYFDGETFQFAPPPDAIERGIKHASHAVTLDQNNQYAHHCRAYSALVQRDRGTMKRSAERMITINSNAASMIAYAGFWLCLAGEYESGMKWFNKGTQLNPLFPSWLHVAPFFYYINTGDFGKALRHAYDFELPGFFWGSLMRATALGLLGRTTEAKRAYDNLIKIKPDFAQNARSYVDSFIMDENLVDKILKGIAVSQHAK